MSRFLAWAKGWTCYLLKHGRLWKGDSSSQPRNVTLFMLPFRCLLDIQVKVSGEQFEFMSLEFNRKVWTQYINLGAQKWFRAVKPGWVWVWQTGEQRVMDRVQGTSVLEVRETGGTGDRQGLRADRWARHCRRNRWPWQGQVGAAVWRGKKFKRD